MVMVHSKRGIKVKSLDIHNNCLHMNAHEHYMQKQWTMNHTILQLTFLMSNKL